MHKLQSCKSSSPIYHIVHFHLLLHVLVGNVAMWQWGVGLGLRLGVGEHTWSAMPNKQMGRPLCITQICVGWSAAAAMLLLRFVSMCRKKLTWPKKRRRGLQPWQMRVGEGVGPHGW